MTDADRLRLTVARYGPAFRPVSAIRPTGDYPPFSWANTLAWLRRCERDGLVEVVPGKRVSYRLTSAGRERAGG